MQSEAEKILMRNIQNIITKSNRKCSSSYYIVKLKSKNFDFCKNEDLVKQFLISSENNPYACYYNRDSLFLIFGSSDYLKKFYHKIISNYITLFYKSAGIESSAECSLIEFDTRIQILMFFSITIQKHRNKYIESLLGKDFCYLTQKEIDVKLEKKSIKTENHEIYGKFTKLKEKKKRYCLASFSEPIDISDSDKYINFIFG